MAKPASKKVAYSGENPPDLEVIAKDAGIDLSKWDVSKHDLRTNHKRMRVKDAEGNEELVPVTTWGSNTTFTPKPPSEIGAKSFLDNWKAPRIRKPKYGRKKKDALLYEIMPTDTHLGSLCWSMTTGADYDPEITRELFLGAFEELLDHAAHFDIGEILVVLGSDFFHVDSWRGQTNAGTPVGVPSDRARADDRFQRVFRMGCEMFEEAILMCREVAPVNVVHIPGNHDTETSFYLSEVMRAVFRKDKAVRFTETMRDRVYIQYGEVLLCLAHGDKPVDMKKYPNLMAQEAPEMWSSTTHREIHLGHLHHVRDYKEDGGVRVRGLPAMAATDDWHCASGYIGAKRACEGYLWSKTRGYVGHFSSNVK